MITRPNTSQTDRDLIEDALADLDDSAGTGQNAHDEPVVAS